MVSDIISKQNTEKAHRMESKEIKINRNINIMQVSSWMKLNMKQDADKLKGIEMLEFKAKVLSIFSNASFYDAMNIDLSDLNRGFKTIIDLLSNIPKEEPKELLTIKGHDFRFTNDMSKLSVGQAMDIKKLGRKAIDRPAYMMAVLYSSDTCNRKEAEDIFRLHFPVGQFLAVFNFFFLKFRNWNDAIMIIQTMRMNEMKRLEKMAKIRAKGLRGSKLQGLLSTWRITFIEMWTLLRVCLMQLFYFGTTLRASRLWKKRSK